MGRASASAFRSLSRLTFLAGDLLTYGLSFQIDVVWLIPFAAGNLIYIGASDLVPEVNKQHSAKRGVVHLLTFVAGPAMMLMPQLFF